MTAPRDLPERLARTTAAVCGALASVALVVWPSRWQVAAGVVGGGVLVGLSGWAIRSAVDGALETGAGRGRRARMLVKFFTRHAILALAAYGMMARLHLDPVALLAGVSSLVVAAGIEALRRSQRVS